MFSTNPKIQHLLEFSRELGAFKGVLGLLEWDQETYMPKRAGEARGKQVALIAGLAHERFTDPKNGELLQELEKESNLNEFDKALVREFKRNYDKATKLPTAFVKELAEHTSQSVEIWKEARTKKDFNLFKAALEKTVALKKQEAVYLGFADNPYDALLDYYEPNLKQKDVEVIFEPLKEFTINFVRRIKSSGKEIDSSILNRDYSKEKQMVICNEIAKALGFDYAAGRLDLSTHPFTTEFGTSNDVRITTRAREDQLQMSIMATIHEVGHAMYEQGVSKELDRTVLGEGTSLGMHESQSRMWENFIGRSFAFWDTWFPRLVEIFPDKLDLTEKEAFVKSLNKVNPSLIRVEADEVTYNLHIIIRFEIERDLFAGKIAVSDLPSIWNAKYQDYLGVTPDSDATGVLQDIHWSGGGFGYFPTYTLGNLYAAQLWNSIPQKDPTSLLAWLRENIHKHGKVYSADELCKKATSEGLNAKYLTTYLEEKYSKIYEL